MSLEPDLFDPPPADPDDAIALDDLQLALPGGAALLGVHGLRIAGGAGFGICCFAAVTADHGLG